MDAEAIEAGEETMTTEGMERAVRRVHVRKAMEIAKASGRPILAWLLSRFLKGL
jgi:hypothetical protein